MATQEQFDALTAQLTELLQSVPLDAYQRTSALVAANRELKVPAIIWSPEDFDELAEASEVDIDPVKAWEGLDMDLLDYDWARLESRVQEMEWEAQKNPS